MKYARHLINPSPPSPSLRLPLGPLSVCVAILMEILILHFHYLFCALDIMEMKNLRALLKKMACQIIFVSEIVKKI